MRKPPGNQGAFAFRVTDVVSLSRCPLLLTRDLSALGFRFRRREPPCFFRLPTRTVVFGAVGKWESRVFGEISKEGWEAVETCFWFSPVCMPPPFPPRSGLLGFCNGRPWLSNRPTTCGP